MTTNEFLMRKADNQQITQRDIALNFGISQECGGHIIKFFSVKQFVRCKFCYTVGRD